MINKFDSFHEFEEKSLTGILTACKIIFKLINQHQSCYIFDKLYYKVIVVNHSCAIWQLLHDSKISSSYCLFKYTQALWERKHTHMHVHTWTQIEHFKLFMNLVRYIKTGLTWY